MPDAYSAVIRDVTSAQLSTMLQNSGESSSNMPDYTPIPRAGYQSAMPDTFVDASEAVAAPTEEVVNVNFTPNVDGEAPAPSDDFLNDDEESGAEPLPTSEVNF